MENDKFCKGDLEDVCMYEVEDVFRFVEIAQGMVRCFHPFNAEELLKNISYVDCTNYTELMIAVSNLRNTLLEDQKV